MLMHTTENKDIQQQQQHSSAIYAHNMFREPYLLSWHGENMYGESG